MATNIPVVIRNALDMERVARYFDDFPEPLSIEVDIRATGSVFGAIGLERVLVDFTNRHPASTAPRRPDLRVLAHAAEMLACADEQLARIADTVVAVGRPLRYGERMQLFPQLEMIGHVVMHAAQDCHQMVRDRAIRLAHKLIYLGKNARRWHRCFRPQRLLNRVAAHRAAIDEIMILAPPMV